MDEEVSNEIGRVVDNVRRLRNEKGLSIIELAGRAGVAHSAIFYIESHRKTPTLETLAKVAKGLGIKLKDLFD